MTSRLAIALALLASLAVGASFFTGYEWAPFALVVLAGTLLLVFHNPYVLALTFIAMLYTRPADFIPALAVLQPVKLVAVLALLIWAAGRVLMRRPLYEDSPLVRHFFALVGWLFLCTVTSSDFGWSSDKFQNAFVKIVAAVVLLTHATRTKGRLEAMLVTLSLSGAFLAGYGAWLSFTGQAVVEGSRAAAVGIVGDPNDLALAILSTMGPTLEMSLSGRGGRRVVGLLVTTIGVLGVLSTQSRGGILGLGAMFAVALEPRVKSKAVLLGGVAAVIMALGLFAAVGSRKTVSEGEGIDESAKGRLDAWIAASRMTLRHPVFGVGYDQAAFHFEEFAINPVFWGAHETHNSYLKAYAETGVVGGTLFIGLVLRSFLAARKLQKRKDLPAAARGLAPGIAAYLVSAFFLSQCWGWFAYVLAAGVDAAQRLQEPDACVA